MKLISSLREKKRYVKFSVDGNFSNSQVKTAIESSFKDLHGSLGLAEAGLQFVNLNKSNGVVRVNNKTVDKLKSAFTFIDKINEKPARISSLKTSGILERVI